MNERFNANQTCKSVEDGISYNWHADIIFAYCSTNLGASRAIGGLVQVMTPLVGKIIYLNIGFFFFFFQKNMDILNQFSKNIIV